MKPEALNKVDVRLRHIAFIMDGNGRWANKRGMPREYAHKKGVEVFKTITEYCHKIGVQCVTVYAFSTENWKRPQREVDSIMKLLDEYLDKSSSEDVSVRFIGDTSRLDPSLVKKIEAVEERTKDGKAILNVALNYGSRSEIVMACNKLIAEGKSEISESDLNSALYTGDCPDPDLVVRTAGEQRLSNFLLWQAAYAEFYFTDTLWPDFGPQGVEEAIKAYYRRTRRFGAVK